MASAILATNISVAVKQGFVRYDTDVSVHDSQVFRPVDGTEIGGDSAYHSTDLEWPLERVGLTSQIHELSKSAPNCGKKRKESYQILIQSQAGTCVGSVGHGSKFAGLIGKTRVQAAISLKNLAGNSAVMLFGSGSISPVICDF